LQNGISELATFKKLQYNIKAAGTQIMTLRLIRVSLASLLSGFHFYTLPKTFTKLITL
jgi:hypothetical protein